MRSLKTLPITAGKAVRKKRITNLTKKKDSFWDRLSRAEQEKYLEAHPDSKYKDAPLKTETKESKDAPEKNAPTKETEPKPLSERPKKRLTDVIKDWHKEQKQFFESGQHNPDSVVRNKAADILVRKHKGLHKSIKNEVKEWKVATNALRKIKRGEGLDHHDKEALKSVALHTGIVVGDFALSGGAKTFLSGAAALMSGFLSHSLMVNYGKAAVYAAKKPSKYDEDDTDDELLYELLHHMSEGMRSAPVSTEQWVTAFEKKGAKNAKPKK